jgi:hypothetical protein
VTLRAAAFVQIRDLRSACRTFVTLHFSKLRAALAVPPADA